MDVEVEVRSFISESKYHELLEFMRKNAKPLKEDYQISYYLSGEHDLRIQKNNFFSKIWMKGGKIHDKYRREIEIKFDREDFEKLVNLFLTLGFEISVKWFRKRHVFKWEDLNVMIDDTEGYGRIIELEKISTKERKEEDHRRLKRKLLELGIDLTPREEFKKRFNYYKENWEDLVKSRIR